MSDTAKPAPLRADAGGSRARFLFREDQGFIDAATWRFHAGWLVATVIVLTLIWFALQPFAHHDLARQAFIAPMTIVAYTYLIVYSFAVLLIAVCYVMLTMKRCRGAGVPVALAGLVPLLAFLAASLHFLHKQTPDVIVVWQVVVLDGALVAALLWTIVRLGGGRQDRGPNSAGPGALA